MVLINIGSKEEDIIQEADVIDSEHLGTLAAKESEWCKEIRMRVPVVPVSFDWLGKVIVSYTLELEVTFTNGRPPPTRKTLLSIPLTIGNVPHMGVFKMFRQSDPITELPDKVMDKYDNLAMPKYALDKRQIPYVEYVQRF